MMEPRRAGWFFGAVSVLCIVAAVIPLLRGGRPNVVFLASGGVFLVVAIGAQARKQRTGRKPPSAV